ncbi:MAG: helix-turn-helix transcriptional regulator [Actinoplanes sp.]
MPFDVTGANTMPEQIGQAVARERLRARLVHLRRQRKLSPESVVARTHWSLSKLNRIETGAVTVQPLDVQALLNIYEVHDPAEIDAMTGLSIVARRRQWWNAYQLDSEDRDFVAYESAAARITIYQALLIPDLLQTEAYARTVLTSAAGQKPDDPAVQNALELRLRRQSELAGRMRGPQPPHMFAILDGAVLERRIGGAAVMRAQLNRLLDLIAEDQVRVMVIPLRQGMNPGSGGFELLEFAGVEDPDVVFVESPVRDFVLRDKEDTAGYHDVVDTLVGSGLTRDPAIREIKRIRGGL